MKETTPAAPGEAWESTNGIAEVVPTTFAEVLYKTLRAAKDDHKRIVLRGVLGEQTYTGEVEYLSAGGARSYAGTDSSEQVERLNEAFVTLRVGSNGHARFVVVRLGTVESFEVVA